MGLSERLASPLPALHDVAAGLLFPVRADGQVFADGGLLDNLPVDVAKQMGAQITIAVYLETQPMPQSR